MPDVKPDRPLPVLPACPDPIQWLPAIMIAVQGACPGGPVLFFRCGDFNACGIVPVREVIYVGDPFQEPSLSITHSTKAFLGLFPGMERQQ
jgi:hypothetical protein